MEGSTIANKIFEAIRAKQNRQRQKGIESFAGLVEAFWNAERGRGPEPTVEQVERVLTESGQTPERIEQILDTRRAILREAKSALEAERFDVETRECRAKLAEVEKAFEQAKRDRERNVAELASKENVAMSKARTARESLARLATLLTPSEREAELTDEMREMGIDFAASIQLFGLKNAAFPSPDNLAALEQAGEAHAVRAAQRDELRRSRVEAALKAVAEGSY